MKQNVSAYFIGVAIAIFATGCQTPEARIVRLKLDSDQWQYSINGHGRTIISRVDLTNRLAGLHFHHGDLILFGTVPFSPPGTKETWGWLTHFCRTNHVAAYWMGDNTTEDIFLAPAYHWVAPFENPRTLQHTSFFHEGQLLGYKMDGYRKMVRRIVQTHPRQIFILGSLWDQDSGFGMNEVPYENEEQLLNNATTKIGVEFLLPNSLIGDYQN